MSKIFRLFLWSIASVLVGSYICGPLVDPDIWWHTVVGRWIIAHHQVPWVDYWTVEGVGRPWIAYSWLFEVGSALVEKRWGIEGLAFSQLLLTCLLSMTCCFVSAKISKSWCLGILLGSLGALCSINSITLRPQLFSWIFFALSILVSDLICKEGIRKRYLALLALIFVLWANVHFSAIFGIFAVLSWLLGSVDLDIWVSKKQSLIFGLAISILCGMATFITPYAGREWGVMFETASHPMLFEQIAEFSPATILRESSSIFLLFSLMLAFLLHEAPRSIELPKFVGLGVLTLLGLSVVKFFPYAAIYLMALTSLIWSRGSERTNGLGQLGEGIGRLVQQLERFPTWLSTLLVAAAILSNVSKLIDKPVSDSRIARSAMDLFLAEGLPFPLLNTFSDGGYLIYRLADGDGSVSNPVSIDGRTNLISKELWSDYEEASSGGRNWHRLLDRFHPQTILWRSQSPFITLLLESGDWCEVGTEDLQLRGTGYSLVTKKGTKWCPLRK